MTNPIPERISDEMWEELWLECTVPGKRLGGFFNPKTGYHEDRNGNPPTNYSVILLLDKQGSGELCAGFDLTLSDEQMKIVTKRVMDSCLDPRDPRCNILREFFGTLDGKTVVGLRHNSLTDAWFKVTSDLSHLWHKHYSIFRAFTQNRKLLADFMTVVNGVSYEEWVGEEEDMGIIGLKEGDRGQRVRYLQRRLVKLGFDTINPEEDPEDWRYDGIWGEGVTRAVKASRTVFGYQNPDLKEITGWHAEDMDEKLANKGKITITQVKKEITTWFESNRDKFPSADTEEIIESLKQYLMTNKEEFQGEPGQDAPDTITVRFERAE
jgi:hypothetical protein